jgi:hypothetical protein
MAPPEWAAAARSRGLAARAPGRAGRSLLRLAAAPHALPKVWRRPTWSSDNSVSPRWAAKSNKQHPANNPGRGIQTEAIVETTRRSTEQNKHETVVAEERKARAGPARALSGQARVPLASKGGPRSCDTAWLVGRSGSAGCWQPILWSGLGLCTGAAAAERLGKARAGPARALSGQARVPLASKGGPSPGGTVTPRPNTQL